MSIACYQKLSLGRFGKVVELSRVFLEVEQQRGQGREVDVLVPRVSEDAEGALIRIEPKAFEDHWLQGGDLPEVELEVYGISPALWGSGFQKRRERQTIKLLRHIDPEPLQNRRRGVDSLCEGFYLSSMA